jgi:hypothetical protein
MQNNQAKDIVLVLIFKLWQNFKQKIWPNSENFNFGIFRNWKLAKICKFGNLANF